MPSLFFIQIVPFHKRSLKANRISAYCPSIHVRISTLGLLFKSHFLVGRAKSVFSQNFHKFTNLYTRRFHSNSMLKTKSHRQSPMALVFVSRNYLTFLSFLFKDLQKQRPRMSCNKPSPADTNNANSCSSTIPSKYGNNSSPSALKQMKG